MADELFQMCLVVVLGVVLMIAGGIVCGTAEADLSETADLLAERYDKRLEHALAVTNVTDTTWRVSGCVTGVAPANSTLNSCEDPSSFDEPCWFTDQCDDWGPEVDCAYCSNMCSAPTSACSTERWEDAGSCRTALAEQGCAYASELVYACEQVPDVAPDTVVVCGSFCADFRCEPYDPTCDCTRSCERPAPDRRCWVEARVVRQETTWTARFGYTVGDVSYPTRFVGPEVCAGAWTSSGNCTDDYEEVYGDADARTVWHKKASGAFTAREPYQSRRDRAHSLYDTGIWLVCFGAAVFLSVLCWCCSSSGTSRRRPFE